MHGARIHLLHPADSCGSHSICGKADSAGRGDERGRRGLQLSAGGCGHCMSEQRCMHSPRTPQAVQWALGAVPDRLSTGFAVYLSCTRTAIAAREILETHVMLPTSCASQPPAHASEVNRLGAFGLSGRSAKSAGRAEVADAPPLASHTSPHQSLRASALSIRCCHRPACALGAGEKPPSRQGRKKMHTTAAAQEGSHKWMAPLAF